MSIVKLEDLKYVGTEASEVEVLEPDKEVVAEIEETAEIAEEPVESSDVATSAETETLADEFFENAEPAKVEPSENKIVNVTKLRIYSIPSTKVPARSFTGNVVVIGHIDKFVILEYVRAGFGKVKGYAIDSELPR